MDQQLSTMVERVGQSLPATRNAAALEALKATVFGPRGEFTEARKKMATLPPGEKPAFGKALNEAKNKLEALFEEAAQTLEEQSLRNRFGPPVDVTLPSPDPAPGSLHPLTRVREHILGIFRRLGFSVAEGTDVETEYFCFDALNTPADHPARDLHDTYYLKGSTRLANVSRQTDRERYLLRTHTSSVQVRTMLETSPPVRIVSPGRCFRRDTADATHSANFHQIEGLYVDEGVTVRDLKALLDHFMRELLGPAAKTRFRPHFFPYTEPSFEVDFSAAHLGKVGSNWIEIMGCGMVDPAVFEAVGYDRERYTGFAFGLGIERVAMILYGIDDIRYFYQNDLRFLRQFA